MVFGTHCIKPHSSLSVTTPYVRISEPSRGQVQPKKIPRVVDKNSRSCLLRDSEFAFSSLLMMALKSINRASFRRSSLGLPRNMYVCPFDPRIVILRGFASERMISISSENSTDHGKHPQTKKKWRPYLRTSVLHSEKVHALNSPW